METLLTSGQVAEKLGVSRQRVAIWLREGRIRSVEVAGMRLVRPRDARRPKPQPPGRKAAADS